MAQDACPLEWEIEVPGRGNLGMRGSRPRGRVHISTEDHGDEVFTIPAAVARALAADKKSGKLAPSSRAELLWSLRETSSKQAMRRVASLVDRRDYSRKELTDKLLRDGYRDEVVQATVGRAVESGMVDDRRFADVFVRTKVSAGWGLRRVVDELRRRGIDVDDLPGWPYDYVDPDDEAARAREVAARHHVTGKNRFQKLVRFLVGRGFSTGVAYDAARSVLEEGDDD